MNIKEFLNEDQAVSPVIGVILMVAITVILAAVIGTFVLGLGDSVQTTSPNANFAATQENSGTNVVTQGDDIDVMSFTHEGGDQINVDNLEISTGLNVDNIDNLQAQSDDFSGVSDDRMSAGQTAFYNVTADNTEGVATIEEGTSFRMVWESDDGSSSATLRTFELSSDLTIDVPA